jgi:hypothetical protein
MQERAVVRALNQTETAQAIQAVFARISGYREPSELSVIPMQVLAFLWAEDPQESMTALMEAVEGLPPAAQYRILMTEPQEGETWNSPDPSGLDGAENPTLTEYAQEQEAPHQIMRNLAVVMLDNYEAWISDGGMPELRT